MRPHHPSCRYILRREPRRQTQLSGLSRCPSTGQRQATGSGCRHEARGGGASKAGQRLPRRSDAGAGRRASPSAAAETPTRRGQRRRSGGAGLSRSAPRHSERRRIAQAAAARTAPPGRRRAAAPGAPVRRVRCPRSVQQRTAPLPDIHSALHRAALFGSRSAAPVHALYGVCCSGTRWAFIRRYADQRGKVTATRATQQPAAA